MLLHSYPVAAAAPLRRRRSAGVCRKTQVSAVNFHFNNIRIDPMETQQRSVMLGLHKIVTFAPRRKLLHTDNVRYV